jgi:hypothetical protein
VWQNSLTPVILLALRQVRGHLSAVSRTTAISKHSNKPDLKEEARMVSEFVDQMIKRGEARHFLIKHGFFTKSGKLTKRYGG